MVNSNPKRSAMSAPAGNSLPQEINEAILRNLPAKSLGRFKSVSKAWCSLISDPQFIKTHIDSHQTRKLILVSKTRSLYSIDVNELVPYLNSDEITATAKELIFRLPLIRWKEILGSCNGLVLAKYVNDAIFLMNPTTREVLKVPDSPFAHLRDGKFIFRYGFGYDSSTDDYKVVSVSFWDRRHTDKVVTVYSLRNNSWRRLPDYPCDYGIFSVAIGALINHNCHWLVNSSMIIAFSFANEEFSEINLRDLIHNENDEIYDVVVVDIGGKLGVFLGSWYVTYRLWVMGEYGVCKSWTRIFTYEFKDIVSSACLVEGSNRDIVLDKGLEALFVFNIDERRCRNVRIRIVGDPIHFI